METETTDKVHAWRANQLERAGLNTNQAHALADTRLDLHDTIETLTSLLNHGCPPDIAYDILTDQ